MLMYCSGGELMQTVTPHHRSRSLKYYPATVQRVGRFMQGHAGHLRFQKITWPKMCDNTPILRRQSAMCIPEFGVNTIARASCDLVAPIGNNEFRCAVGQECKHTLAVKFVDHYGNRRQIDTAVIAEKLLFSFSAPTKVLAEQIAEVDRKARRGFGFKVLTRFAHPVRNKPGFGQRFYQAPMAWMISGYKNDAHYMTSRFMFTKP